NARCDPRFAGDDRRNIGRLRDPRKALCMVLKGRLIGTIARNDERRHVPARQRGLQPGGHIGSLRRCDEHDTATIWCLLVTHDLSGLALNRLLTAYLGLNWATDCGSKFD